MSTQVYHTTSKGKFLTLLCKSSTVHIFLLLIIYLPIVLFLAYKTQGIPYWGDGDYERHAEHYIPYLNAYNLLHYDFFKSYGLIDISMSTGPAAHPFVYIHGSSLPQRLFSFVLLWLGAESIYQQTLIFVIITAVWVPLAYLALSRLFNSYVAVLSTLLIATDYYSILTSSVNLTRGWHVVIFFYGLWAGVQLDFKKRNYSQYLHLGLALFLAITFELPFAALTLLFAAYVIYLNSRALVKTAVVLAVPVIITVLMLAAQITLYLGNITEVMSHTYATFLYRLDLKEDANDTQDFYQTHRIIFWNNKADPIATAINFIPQASRQFIKINGGWLAGFVFISNLFVLYWYLFRHQNSSGDAQLSDINFNPAHFLLFALFAILFTTLVFPSVLDFYNRRSMPLVVFFVFISVPLFLNYLQQKFSLSPALWVLTFLIFWFTAQLQVFNHAPPSPDGLQKILQRNYRGASIGVTFGAYPWQALWYAARTDAFSLEKRMEQIEQFPTQQVTHPGEIFYYNPIFSYQLKEQLLPEYIIVDTRLWPSGTLKNKLLDNPGVTVDAEYDRFKILKLSDRSLSGE